MTTLNSIMFELLHQICIDNVVAIKLMKTNKYFLKNVEQFITSFSNLEMSICNTVILNI